MEAATVSLAPPSYRRIKVEPQICVSPVDEDVLPLVARRLSKTFAGHWLVDVVVIPQHNKHKDTLSNKNTAATRPTAPSVEKREFTSVWGNLQEQFNRSRSKQMIKAASDRFLFPSVERKHFTVIQALGTETVTSPRLKSSHHGSIKVFLHFKFEDLLSQHKLNKENKE